ncbi:endonuclease Q family protein [Caldisericum exile]|uniref:DNA helicase UvrD n=1 Tax=Caldisericum exile (strain DSM 21853 / NBRC 104410 / AZM16c01) TaxID=511051 RepID=A0A7U6GF57_CALEA|nr:endonuclease Q family protein [Caldisericum exile]BAL81278.1 hypothetical protein CSE_11520 [Caldisericum exile AZM16c01]
MQEIDILDYHLHSFFSIPSSRFMDIPHMVEYAKVKGVTILGTGDIFLPKWKEQISKNLSFENGFYYFGDFPFILTGEVNLTFERDRKKSFHVVLAFPTIKDVEEFEKAFKKFSNFEIIARPNIKVTPKEFVRILKNINPSVPIILAHIFTPHYGALGSSNNFESLKEIFETDFIDNLFIETGLSADPKMVYSVSELRMYPILSSSDSHSPTHIGREATATKKASGFYELFENLKDVSNNFTIENFPQLGKYYLDGHRKCKYKTNDFSVSICPVCGKYLTKGVLHRVEELGKTPQNNVSTLKYFYFIPLEEILNRTYKKSEQGKIYLTLISEFGNELNVVLFSDLNDVALFVNDKTLRYLEHIRNGLLNFEYGYDGVYGDWEVKVA